MRGRRWRRTQFRPVPPQPLKLGGLLRRGTPPSIGTDPGLARYLRRASAAPTPAAGSEQSESR